MMIHATRFFEIEAEQIEALVREKDPKSDCPYVLKIITKTGNTYKAKYAHKIDRENAISQILADLRKCKEEKQHGSN